MEPEESNKSPPKNWRSANKLRREGLTGGVSAINRKLEALRQGLIGDIAAAGIAEAQAIVDHNLVGLRKNATGPAALYGSPEAITMLGLRKSFPAVSPPASPDWLSGNKLSRRGYVGNNATLDRKLREFRSSLIQDITAAGIADSEAEAIVDHNLIGMRLTMGQEAYHGSPEAIAMMEREEKIKKRENLVVGCRAKDVDPEKATREI